MKPKTKKPTWERAIDNRIRWANRQNTCEFWKDFARELLRVKAFIKCEYAREFIEAPKRKKK